MRTTARLASTPMRTRHVCPKCQHNRILLVAAVPEYTDSNIMRAASIATVVVGKTFMGDDKLGAAGPLSAAVCRACGYVELYVDDPGAIPVDGTRVREVVGPKG